MKTNEPKETPKVKKVKNEIDIQIEQLQKHYQAENTALKKLLDGLEKLENSKNNSSVTK